ncbi:MAG: hypothetical protein KAW12_02535 [Candidatus Aminicenantes bacterium]|nr:hypothetical protein [Candidatus Aminicenantes bacterium]
MIPSIILFINNCSGSKTEQAHYKKADLKINSVEFTSKELISINHAAAVENKIFAIGLKYNIWRINLEEKKEEKIIEMGIGPDEIYKARRLTIHKGRCWVSTSLNWDKIYIFDILKEKPEVEWFKLPTGITNIDSLFPISGNIVACVYHGWEDNLVKIIDREKGTVKGAGKRTFIKAMRRFNVNVADIFIYKGNAYVTQTIEPVVQIFSTEPLRKIGAITLSPPFYDPIPKKYDVQKYNRKKHFEWMSRWNRVHKIFIEDDWVLLRYVRGYKVTFYYELINLNDKKNRYYIDATSEFIYDFKVIDGKFIVRSSVENEDDIKWKKGEIII